MSNEEIPNPYEAPAARTQDPQRPASYLWQAIAVNACCCVPFGIPAVVYAARVDPLWFGGNHVRAIEASRIARMWCLIGVGVWVVVMIGWAIAVAYIPDFPE
jgi:hypothetical protein